MRLLMLVTLAIALCGCERLANVGRVPALTRTEQGAEYYAMTGIGLPRQGAAPTHPGQRASLWSGNRQSLLGDRRAGGPGDILTVVIEIDDEAAMSNSSGRSRSGSESLSIPSFFGLPQRMDEEILAEGATMADAVSGDSASDFQGDGSVTRKEKLELRIAATVTGRMPNGVLQIEGSQEVRVNFEIRELLVTGFVRPEDISRLNEITYDKIAGARISYGGRGQIFDVQQPRYGQQIADILLPM